ncbi:MAG TPA: hypothetical protein VEK76_01145 [Candidatus Binatia bacterium]|nr:hypothetical protein [Candidatus Binatia bacterium]
MLTMHTTGDGLGGQPGGVATPAAFVPFHPTQFLRPFTAGTRS